MKRLALALAIPLVASQLMAARSPASSAPSTQSPKQTARANYESGERRLDSAAKLAAEVKAAPDAAAAEKKNGKLKKTLEGAVADFQRAVKDDPMLYQAYSELGFALRKLGRHDESLAAYDTALDLQPNYSPAIAYRAEAYLELNRVEDAKKAYALLYNGDRERADVVFAAMQTWVATHQDDPAAQEFAKWVEQRSALHQTPPATSASIRTW